MVGPAQQMGQAMPMSPEHAPKTAKRLVLPIVITVIVLTGSAAVAAWRFNLLGNLPDLQIADLIEHIPFASTMMNGNETHDGTPRAEEEADGNPDGEDDVQASELDTTDDDAHVENSASGDAQSNLEGSDSETIQVNEGRDSNANGESAWAEESDGSSQRNEGAFSETPDTTVDEPSSEDTEIADEENKEQEGSISHSEMFPREWAGRIGSQQASGTIETDYVNMVFMQVAEDGSVYGLCEVSKYENSPESFQGSYYFTGYIDWSTRDIELWWTSWANQGVLENKRQFAGKFDSSITTITGKLENLSGKYPGSWSLTAI